MRRDSEMGDQAEKDWKSSREGPGLKVILAIAAIAILVVFALQNTDAADIDFLFWDAGVALWIVIGVTAILGFVVGWLLGRASGKRRAIERIATD
jgi:uncharacterized integral membrane protein